MQVEQGAAAIRTKVVDRAHRLRHRGPDWSGVYCKGKNILTHERLAIVDIESGGQPLVNRERTIALAVNGEIYNHKELHSDLKDPNQFQTHSDCEIILRFYEEQSAETQIVDWLNKLNGIFAFILVDERTNDFLIARDHMGIIPLYYGTDAEGSLWVSSEMKGLVDVCVTFDDFPPGHYMTTDRKIQPWYTPAWKDESFLPNTPLDLVELKTQLEDAVRRQLMSDVPYGVLLSGGLDSSLIAAIASRINAERVAANPDAKNDWGAKLHSFSIGLRGSPDLAAAEIVAKQIGTIHHAFEFTIEEGLDAYNDVIYHLETYDVTTIRAATPMYLMSRRIKCLGVKMVLSGEGSDEIFGGYLYFHKCPNRQEMQLELIRKLNNLYKFDCLRANKSTAAWGVEARVPFLDKEFLDYAMIKIDPQDKLCGFSGQGRIEKHILREAFKGQLPESVLWRQKEQFSDGVGYSWIDSIKARAESSISDDDFNTRHVRFPFNVPATKEAYYIRQVYESHFPGQAAAACVPGGPSVACSTPAAILWDQSFQQMADCSGRSVKGVHNDAYTEERRQAEANKGGKVDVQVKQANGIH